MSHKNLDTPIDKINEELEKVNVWIKLNKLSLNLTKTNFMLLKSSRKNVDQELRIKIKDHCITQVKSTKCHGTIIDKQLKPTEHINYVANQIIEVYRNIMYGKTLCDKIFIDINLLRFNFPFIFLWKCCIG